MTILQRQFISWQQQIHTLNYTLKMFSEVLNTFVGSQWDSVGCTADPQLVFPFANKLANPIKPESHRADWNKTKPQVPVLNTFSSFTKLRQIILSSLIINSNPVISLLFGVQLENIWNILAALWEVPLKLPSGSRSLNKKSAVKAKTLAWKFFLTRKNLIKVNALKPMYVLFMVWPCKTLGIRHSRANHAQRSCQTSSIRVMEPQSFQPQHENRSFYPTNPPQLSIEHY